MEAKELSMAGSTGAFGAVRTKGQTKKEVKRRKKEEAEQSKAAFENELKPEVVPKMEKSPEAKAKVKLVDKEGSQS